MGVSAGIGTYGPQSSRRGGAYACVRVRARARVGVTPRRPGHGLVTVWVWVVYFELSCGRVPFVSKSQGPEGPGRAEGRPARFLTIEEKGSHHLGKVRSREALES